MWQRYRERLRKNSAVSLMKQVKICFNIEC